MDNIRSHAPISSERQEAVENEVERRNNSNMSVEGLPPQVEKPTKRQLRERQKAARKVYEEKREKVQLKQKTPVTD